MHPLLQIFLYNIVPILLLVLAGFFFGKHFEPDLRTLTKMNFYLFVPAFTFTYLYSAKIGQDQRMAFVGAVLILILNFIIGKLIAKALRLGNGMEQAFQNSMMFYNSGNVGVPLITLIYSSGYIAGADPDALLTAALTTQVMVLVVQNLSTNTLGFYNASRGQGKSIKEGLIKVFQMPTIYTIALALILRQIPSLDLTTTPIWPALDYCRAALVAIALVTMGVQLSRTTFEKFEARMAIASVARLFGGPLIALLVISLLKLEGLPAQVLFISSSVPTAVNTALLAAECENHPDFAAQIVLITTVACPITLIPIIYLAPQLFPL